MKRFFAALVLALFALPDLAAAQEQPNTILVLDASGSMWGQIESVNKIVIARDVVGMLLNDFPDDQNLGLTVYGHRERGNCSDIETVVAPGVATKSAIRDAVNGINPRGKTPMTDAIIAAAEALRYTEERATVILVSDGIETCNPDPCAAALALEEAGVDFTAHVVGFDVTDPEALAQMQCLADNTGGTFTTASNADELAFALETVAVAPPPEPEPVITEVTFEARIGSETGNLIETPVFWDVVSDTAEPEVSDAQGNPLVSELAQGSYTVTGYWAAEETEATRQFIATAAARTIVVVFEEPPLTATVTAPATAAIGSTIEVSWDGPNFESDYIGISPVGENGWDNYTYTREGETLTLLMPTEPGVYEIQYFLNEARTPIGSTQIELTDIPFAIIAPETAEIGQEIEVGWTGPGYESDYIGIGPLGEGRWDNYTYTREGNPLMLKMPPEPGEYEISYFMNQDRVQKASVSITLTEAQVSVTAPATATAGEIVEVAWVGPNYDGDYIGIGPLGEGRWDNYTYTREGSPLMLQMPTEPGTYDITYFLNQNRKAIFTTSIVVEDVAASLTTPDTAVAGSTIEVSWTGPNYEGDYIGIGPVGAGKWDNYTYTRDGSTLMLQMPVEAGTYDITYFLSQDRTGLVTVPITLTAPTYDLAAPGSAPEGSTIEVSWEGPNYDGDYLGVGPAGAGRWDTYSYTRDGNPLQLRLPLNAGSYEISYFLGQDRHKAVTVPITLTPVDITLTAPSSALAGSEIEVAWTGPNYDGDYIGIGPRGQGSWTTYAYTRDGSVLTIAVPEGPGAYEISYFIGQGRTQKTAIPFTVE